MDKNTSTNAFEGQPVKAQLSEDWESVVVAPLAESSGTPGTIIFPVGKVQDQLIERLSFFRDHLGNPVESPSIRLEMKDGVLGLHSSEIAALNEIKEGFKHGTRANENIMIQSLTNNEWNRLNEGKYVSTGKAQREKDSPHVVLTSGEYRLRIPANLLPPEFQKADNITLHHNHSKITEEFNSPPKEGYVPITKTALTIARLFHDPPSRCRPDALTELETEVAGMNEGPLRDSLTLDQLWLLSRTPPLGLTSDLLNPLMARLALPMDDRRGKAIIEQSFVFAKAPQQMITTERYNDLETLIAGEDEDVQSKAALGQIKQLERGPHEILTSENFLLVGKRLEKISNDNLRGGPGIVLASLLNKKAASLSGECFDVTEGLVASLEVDSRNEGTLHQAQALAAAPAAVLTGERLDSVAQRVGAMPQRSRSKAVESLVFALRNASQEVQTNERLSSVSQLINTMPLGLSRWQVRKAFRSINSRPATPAVQKSFGCFR